LTYAHLNHTKLSTTYSEGRKIERRRLSES